MLYTVCNRLDITVRHCRQYWHIYCNHQLLCFLRAKIIYFTNTTRLTLNKKYEEECLQQHRTDVVSNFIVLGEKISRCWWCISARYRNIKQVNLQEYLIKVGVCGCGSQNGPLILVSIDTFAFCLWQRGSLFFILKMELGVQCIDS